MQQYSYLAINFFTFFSPLISGLLIKKKIWVNVLAYLKSMGVVSFVFLVWDYFATARGDWAFSSARIMGFKVLGLPVEEILFFVTTSFACLFIYETVKYLLPQNKSYQNKFLSFGVFVTGILALLFAVILQSQFYTASLLLMYGLTIMFVYFFDTRSLLNNQFLLTTMIVFIPFFVINSILTGLPIVTYASSAIWGLRLGTIPIEDAIYNFVMLYWHMRLYEKFGV